MTKFKFLLMVFISLKINVMAQVTEGTSPIKWYTFNQAQELNKKQPRTLFIDVYTDWCGWCKYMMSTTFTDPNIANYINNNFYPVRFDAEGHDTIKYRDTLYFNKGKNHDFAIKLLDGRLSYPTIVYLDPDFNKLVVPGAMKAQEIEPLLIFFGEGVNKTKTSSIEDFKTNFEKTFQKSDTLKVTKDSISVKWYSFEEAVKLNAAKPKKILIDMYIPWYVTSKVMLKTTYNNPQLAQYINNNYYPVHFNATSHDTVRFAGYTFLNPSTEQFSLHQLAAAFLQNELVFPTALFLDENNKLVNRISGYLSPESLDGILHYFGDNAYKSTPWLNYISTFKSTLKK